MSADAHSSEKPEWCSAPPRHVVDRVAKVNRSLEEVLDAVEGADTVIDVHRRIGSTAISETKRMLADLGLLAPHRMGFVDDDVLEERLRILREIA